MEENDFWSPLHPSIFDGWAPKDWHLPGTNLLGFALLEPAMQASFLPHHWAEIWLMRKSCQGESPATLCLKTPSSHPRAKAGRKPQFALVTCMAKPSCFLWLAHVGFERALQWCFSLSLMVPMGRPRTVGLQLRLSWCSLEARKEPGHSCLGCNRRYPWHHFRAGSLQACGPSGFEICTSRA